MLEATSEGLRYKCSAGIEAADQAPERSRSSFPGMSAGWVLSDGTTRASGVEHQGPSGSNGNRYRITVPSGCRARGAVPVAARTLTSRVRW